MPTSVRMLYVYTPSQKFNIIRISQTILRDITKIFKTQIFSIIIIPKRYSQIDKKKNCPIINQVTYSLFYFRWIYWFFRNHWIFQKIFTFLTILKNKRYVTMLNMCFCTKIPYQNTRIFRVIELRVPRL